ncbi:MAG: hypothetical protein Fur0024_0750 [Patescibacteria group bacterium]
MDFFSGILFLENFRELSLLIFFITTLIFLASYISSVYLYKVSGITTELGALITLFFGFAIGSSIVPIEYIIAFSVIVTTLFAQKTQIESFAKHIDQKEFLDFLKFGIVSVVILPFLPNKNYAISDIPVLLNLLNSFGLSFSKILDLEIFNPFNVWFIVVLISFLDLFGYIAGKIFGAGKSFLISALFGGFVSSTSTTQSFAIQSKKSEKFSKILAGAGIVANIASFFQMILIMASTSALLLTKSISIIFLMIIFGTFFAFFFSQEKFKKC